MKMALFLLTMVTLANFGVATECTIPSDLESKSVYSIYDSYETDLDIIATFSLYEDDFDCAWTAEVMQMLNEYLSLECPLEFMNAQAIRTLNGNVYCTYRTYHDYCDGGNSSGILTDTSYNLVGQIDDSSFYCIEK